MTAAPRKIFLVEDDEHIRLLVETLLKGAGYTIFSTTEPQQAHDIARREQPDLVLCDIAMPVLDGYGVLRELQADPETARIPVVFLTAHREFSERVRAFRFGVVDYVTKPFTRDILLKKIEKVLEGLHHRPGFEGGAGEASVQTLVDEVKREGRSGVLTVSDPKGEQRAVFRGGELVEGVLPPPSEAAQARFQELDHDREAIVAHDPPRLPGSASALEELQALPDALRTVLVVDDNPIFRTFLRDVLSRRNFTVYEASDGGEALRLALEKRPWLILTDVSMPDVDGIEFCRRVRNHSLIRHTPLIFLSGLGRLQGPLPRPGGGSRRVPLQGDPGARADDPHPARAEALLRHRGPRLQGPGHGGAARDHRGAGAAADVRPGPSHRGSERGRGRAAGGGAVQGRRHRLRGRRRPDRSGCHLRAPVLVGRQLLLRPRRGRRASPCSRPSPSCCSRGAAVSTSGARSRPRRARPKRSDPPPLWRARRDRRRTARPGTRPGAVTSAREARVVDRTMPRRFIFSCRVVGSTPSRKAAWRWFPAVAASASSMRALS